MSSVHTACIEFFGEVDHFTERSGFLELCVISEKLMVYRVVNYDIREKRMGPSTEPRGTPYISCERTEMLSLSRVERI